MNEERSQGNSKNLAKVLQLLPKSMFIQTLLDTRTLSVFEDVKCVNMIWALKIIAEELELVLTKDSSWNMLQTPSLSFPIPAHVPYSQPTKAAPPAPHTHQPARTGP